MVLLRQTLPLPLVVASFALPGTAAAPERGAAPQEVFTDRTAAAGLEFIHFNGMAGSFYFPEMVGAGAALFDYDNDGDLDLFLVQGAALGSVAPAAATYPPADPEGLRDRLFRNDLEAPGGEVRFVDVTADSGIDSRGYGMGAATGDFTNSGWIDLYITNFGSNALYRNNGDGTFTDVTGASGSDDRRWSVPALFFDSDRNGWLDLFVGNYVEYSIEGDKVCRTVTGVQDYCGPLTYRPAPDRLLRNRGDGTFEDRTARAGLDRAFGAALGAAAGDFDGDGWPDLYVANDGTPNQMWRNRGDGTFADDAVLAGTAVNFKGEPEASMGVAVGDFDADGDEDIFLTHLTRETNTLYVNDGTGLFEDRTTQAGLATPSWPYTGFGTAWIDIDGDGRLDLVVVNGAVRSIEEQRAASDPYPLREPNQLFRNLGGGRFEEISGRAGAAFQLREVSRGMAVGDVDNSGAPDLVVTQNSGPARLLLNTRRPQVTGHGWVGLRVVEGEPPRDSIGAWVGVFPAAGAAAWRRVGTGGSYASASDPRLLVGLGTARAVERVVVRWPGGGEEIFTPETGRYSTLRRGEGTSVAPQPRRTDKEEE